MTKYNLNNKITDTQLLKLYSALLDTANLLDYAVARACSEHTHDKARAFERVLVLMWEIDKISHKSDLTRFSRGGLAQDHTVDDLVATANIIKRDAMSRLGY